MAREYDAQLLESVAVRRNRMRESLLWGRERRARATMDNLKRLGISVVLAAVACAGCVGWSLLQQMLAEREQRYSSLVSITVPGMTATPATVVRL